MNNKSIALIITIFIIVMLVIIGFMALASHIPFIGKALATLFAMMLAMFVIVIVIISARRKR